MFTRRVEIAALQHKIPLTHWRLFTSINKGKQSAKRLRRRSAATTAMGVLLDGVPSNLGRRRKETPVKLSKRIAAAVGVAVLASLISPATYAQAKGSGKTITLCWAAWDPANALVELSKDFTAKSGVQMKFEFVPWPNFADRMLNELNSKGKLCDLMIGDSQWIGGAAESGHYVKLNDFFAKEGIKMSDFLPATVLGY